MTQQWDAEGIKAEIRRRGGTQRGVALAYGVSPSSVRCAFVQPLYQGEQAVAAFLGVPARELWPDRYDPDGTPRHPRYRRQFIQARAGGHRQTGGSR